MTKYLCFQSGVTLQALDWKRRNQRTTYAMTNAKISLYIVLSAKDSILIKMPRQERVWCLEIDHESSQCARHVTARHDVD